MRKKAIVITLALLSILILGCDSSEGEKVNIDQEQTANSWEGWGIEKPQIKSRFGDFEIKSDINNEILDLSDSVLFSQSIDRSEYEINFLVNSNCNTVKAKYNFVAKRNLPFYKIIPKEILLQDQLSLQKKGSSNVIVCHFDFQVSLNVYADKNKNPIHKFSLKNVIFSTKHRSLSENKKLGFYSFINKDLIASKKLSLFHNELVFANLNFDGERSYKLNCNNFSAIIKKESNHPKLKEMLDFKSKGRSLLVNSCVLQVLDYEGLLESMSPLFYLKEKRNDLPELRIVEFDASKRSDQVGVIEVLELELFNPSLVQNYIISMNELAQFVRIYEYPVKTGYTHRNDPHNFDYKGIFHHRLRFEGPEDLVFRGLGESKLRRVSGYLNFELKPQQRVSLLYTVTSKKSECSALETKKSRLHIFNPSTLKLVIVRPEMNLAERLGQDEDPAKVLSIERFKKPLSYPLVNLKNKTLRKNTPCYEFKRPVKKKPSVKFKDPVECLKLDRGHCD